MAKLVEPEISRLKTPAYYSDDFETAIEEFKKDISAFYIAGYSYNQVIENDKIRKINSYLQKKFPSGNGYNFPFFDKFVNYVYTRDEAINPFGKWYHFYYLEPLKILEFAKYLRDKNNVKQASLTKWASLATF